MKTPTILISTWLGLALLAPGCDKEEPKAKAMEGEEEAPAPNVQVQLPASPNFDEGKTVETYDDGAWSIYGLRRKIDENVAAGAAGKDITVRGYIQEIYVPPECPEGEVCPPGKQPHVWIVDKADQQGKKRAMMVVNYRFQIPEWDAKRWKDQPEVLLEKGKQYTFQGKFKQFSDTGFADDRGLLEFQAYRPLNPETNTEMPQWVHPPGAPWHPMEVARQEEENAALVEKASEAAAQYKNRGK